jgi:hypothetical protein
MNKQKLGLFFRWLSIICPISWLSTRMIWYSWELRNLRWGVDNQQILEDLDYELKYNEK